MNKKIAKYPLTNGSRVVVVSLPGAVSAVTACFVKAGSRWDPPNKAGLAHFTEHVLLESTKKHSLFKLAFELEKIGGMKGGWTEEDYSLFWIKTSYKDIFLGIKFLLEWLCYPLFFKKEIEKEKKVVLQEYYQNLNNPPALIWELWQANIFQGSKLAVTYTGKPTNIERFQRKDIISFYQSRYLANNTLFVVCGKVETEEVKKFCNQNLKDYNRKMSDSPPHFVFKRKHPNFLFTKENGNITLALGYLTTDRYNEDRETLDLIRTILGEGVSSLLWNQLTVKEGFVYDLGVHTDYLLDGGYIVVICETQKENFQRVVNIIDETFSRLAEGKISSLDLKRAKGFFLGNLFCSLESPIDWVLWFGEKELFEEKVLTLKDKEKKISLIDKKKIQQVAKKYFQPPRRHLSVIGGQFGDLKNFKKANSFWGS